MGSNDPILTEKQRTVLSTLPAYVKGSANVQAARRLEALGLATVRDDGELGPSGRGNFDGERWFISITERGEKLRSKLETERRDDTERTP